MKNLVDDTFTDENEGFIVELADQLRNEGFQQGMREGIIEGIRLGISLKFGDEALSLMSSVYAVQDIATLKRISNSIRYARSVTEIRELIR